MILRLNSFRLHPATSTLEYSTGFWTFRFASGDRSAFQRLRATRMVPTDATKSILPNIEISETDKAIKVTAEMPGLERKDARDIDRG